MRSFIIFLLLLCWAASVVAASECPPGTGGSFCQYCINNDGCQLGKQRCDNTTRFFTDIYNTHKQFECGVLDEELIDQIGQTITMRCDENPDSNEAFECGITAWWNTADKDSVFACTLFNCTYSEDSFTEAIRYKCESSTCACTPGTTHCNMFVNYTVQHMTRDAWVRCTGPQRQICVMNHRDYPDPIDMNCRGGECVSSSLPIPGGGDADNEPQTLLQWFMRVALRAIMQNVSLSVAIVSAISAIPLLFMCCCAICVGHCRHQRRMKHQLERMRQPGHQVVLQVRNLSYSVPSGKKGVPPRQILSKVNLTLNSGKVIALMGPSGAGKTTLLNILAQRSMSGKMQGQVLVNNMDISKVPAYKAIVGYVYQHDQQMETLTVQENIHFSLQLRSSMADVNNGSDYLQRMSMVRNTMKALDIAHLADRRVGRADAESGSGMNQRGLSGGERKRVSVAMETVNMPRVLFLDEPTSGLDATAAANLVAYLRTLAKRGVLVVMSIHQPSERVYKELFDEVILVAKTGQVVLHDKIDRVNSFFRDRHCCYMPKDQNEADVIVELLRHWDSELLTVSYSHKDTFTKRSVSDGNSFLESFSEYDDNDNGDGGAYELKTVATKSAVLSQNSRPPSIEGDRNLRHSGNVYASSASFPKRKDGDIRAQGLNDEEFGTSTSDEESESDLLGSCQRYTKDATSSVFEEYNMTESERDETLHELRILSHREDIDGQTLLLPVTELLPYSNSMLQQLIVLNKRTVANFVRSKSLLVTQLIVAVLVGLGLGSLYPQVGTDIEGAQNRLGSMFFTCMVLAFGSLATMDGLIRERQLYIRETSNRYYSPTVYYLSKLLFEWMPLRLIPALIIPCGSYWIIGLKAQLSSFLWYVLIMILFGTASGALGTTVAIASESTGSASVAATVLLLINAVFGGLMLNSTTVPIYYRWAQYLSFWHYAYEALVSNELYDRILTINADIGPVTKTRGQMWMRKLGMDSEMFYIDLIMLCVFAIAYSLLGCVFLRFFVKERK